MIAIEKLVFVDDLTGEITGEIKRLWANGKEIDFVPPDGGPIADALRKLTPVGCHIEIHS